MYHAFLALDHQALVLVHATDAADDVIVFVDVVGVVAVHGIGAVRLTNRLADDLVDLNRGLVSRAVIRLAQPAHVPAHRRLPSVVLLLRDRADDEVRSQKSDSVQVGLDSSGSFDHLPFYTIAPQTRES